MSANRSAWLTVIRDIKAWSDGLIEAMCHVPAIRSGMSRSGQKVDPPLPGGQALALRVRTADGTDPEAIVKDWGLRLRRSLRADVPLARSMSGELDFMAAHVNALATSSFAGECWGELNDVWVKLGKATGHLGGREAVKLGQDPRALADKVPDSVLLTLPEAERFWPGIAQRVRTARSRARVRKVNGEGPAQPDAKGKYLVADLRRYHLTKLTQIV